MDRPQSSERGPVVAIECVAGSSKAEEWGGNMLQTGDVVEEIKIGGSPAVHSPFKGGRSGVQKLLHSAFKRGDTSIDVRVQRCGGEAAELQACIVPHSPAGRRQYVLRSIRDPNYAVGFVDRMVSECVALQGMDFVLLLLLLPLSLFALARKLLLIVGTESIFQVRIFVLDDPLTWTCRDCCDNLTVLGTGRRIMLVCKT
ncbi:hypothetical protein BHE74_00016066 [Ensete ventricosum]|nr:hypothetical protein BHE74_00016066 [Ensete ventricosum]